LRPLLRSRTRVFAGLLVAVGALCVGVAPAGAAPITIGPGHAPAVALDGSGNAYIAWVGPEPADPTSLQFCRLPRGAQACDVRTTIATPGTSITRPFVEVNGSTVRVLSYRYGFPVGSRFDSDLLFTSTDGGATFGPGVAVGITPFYDAVSGPGAGISVVTHAVTAGELFQRVPTNGSSAGDQQALLSTTHPYVGTVALVDGTTPLVVFADGASNAQMRRYTGSGDMNNAANWSPAVDIGHEDWPQLAGGPNGVFLLAEDTANNLRVRRYQDGSFGSPAQIPGGRGEAPQDDFVQDPAGRLHVLLPQITANGSRLLHATSDDGTQWAQTQHAFEPLAQQVRAAVAADHTGVAVWESGSATGPNVYAMALEGGPELGRTVNARVVSGTVRIAIPGSSAARGGRATASQKGLTFVPLAGTRQIPVGSFVDTKRGTVELVSATGTASRTQSGRFNAGLFQVLQSRKRSARGLTELRLKGSSFSRCRARGADGRATAAQLSSRTIRRLRANARGRFRTRARHSAATVRGTVWTTADRCDGTLTQVKRGSVTVRDLRRGRTVVVRAGKSYLARAPR
jgi:hypothetical protein